VRRARPVCAGGRARRLRQDHLLSEWAASTGAGSPGSTWARATTIQDRLIASVKRTVHDAEPHTVLVVDNAHRVSTPETFDALHDVARSMLAGLAARAGVQCEPGLPVGSLRAQRRLFELRTGDMAMTHSEAGALLTAAGIQLASDGLDTLMDRTEGWPRASTWRRWHSKPSRRGCCALALRRR
jgi:hypothetical protein